MNCVLCEQPKALCDSHVIPEFAYRSLYDDKHRAVTFAPTNPESTRYMQKGPRSQLLCAQCETFRNDHFEKPFLAYWLDGNALAAIDGKKGGILGGIDYTAFKLFHLSVLYLAHHSGLPNFAEVHIGANATKIRSMLMARDPGKQWEYPIVCSAIRKPDGKVWDDLVGPAHSILVGPQQAFLFTFAGCQWMYFLSSILTRELDTLCLKENGALPVVKANWIAMEYYREKKKVGNAPPARS